MDEDDLLEETETSTKTSLPDNSGRALSSPVDTPLGDASGTQGASKEVQTEETQAETATPAALGQPRTPPLGPLLDRALERASQGAAGSLTPQRRSSRAAATVDEDSVKKAAKLTAKRNLEEPSGTLSQNSLLTLTDSMMSDNLRSLGIDLGDNDDTCYRSISLIKTNEAYHSLLIPPQKDLNIDTEVNDIESDVDVSDLNIVCGVDGLDVVGDYSDDVSAHSQAAGLHTTNHHKKGKHAKKKGLHSSKELISQ
jgi:hypothetical protein